MLDTREVLQTAINNLEEGEYFQYLDWSRCACGHIYQAATGKVAAPRATGLIDAIGNYKNDAYSRAMVETAYALGMTNDKPVSREDELQRAVYFVSARTLSRAGASYLAKADVAIELYRDAIKALDAQAVLKQLDAIVDNMEIPVAV